MLKPKSNNSLLLTEDKKAFKKSTQYNKNKVRFRFENDQPFSDSELNNNEASENEAPYAKELQLPKNYSSHEELVENMSAPEAGQTLNSYNEFEIPYFQAYSIYQDPSALLSKDKLNAIMSESATHEFSANSSIAIKTLLTTIMSANPNLDKEESSTDPEPDEPGSGNEYPFGFIGESNRSYQLTSSQDYQAMVANSLAAVDEEGASSILKVYLENKVVKSFKYDKNTCVRDVLACLKEKLDIKLIDYFGLVVKLYDDCSISKFVLLEETRQLHQIKQAFGNDNDFKCLFRFIFVPCNFEMLIYHDHNAFSYLYEQVYTYMMLS